VTKPGPKPDPLRKRLRRLFSEWSDRTFATYYLAFRRMSALVEEGVITEVECREIMQSCTRPNGSVNVCKFARIAEARALFWAASVDDDTEATQ
jgi:hypothetical protein